MFELNKCYNYTTLAPEVLGGTYNSMKVKMIMSAEEAVKFRDIHTLHNTLLNTIVGLPTDINDCTFMLLEANDEAKTKTVLAKEYIDNFSITEVTTNNIRVNIFNVNTETMGIVRTRLTELGITNFTLETF